MKLKELHLTSTPHDIDTMQYGPKTTAFSAEIDRATGDLISDEIPNPVTALFHLNQDFHYLIFDDDLILKDAKTNKEYTLSGNNYQFSTFTDYNDQFIGWYNVPVYLNVKANTKFLRFTIDDDMFPPLSVKALTISNSEVDINTNNDTIVIVVGKHSFNGKDSGKRQVLHYRIMDEDPDSANVVHSGTATISTPDTCSVVYIEKK